MTNDATRLLGLDGVAVTSVVTGKDGNPMLALVTVDEQARCCPDCGIRSERPHSWVTTRPRDLPVAGRRTELIWNKRRWRCREAVCPRKTFTEALPQIPSRARLTCRLRESAGAGVSDLGLLGQVEGRTAKSVSAWIKAKTPERRAGVRFVAIDMCAIFKSAVRTSLPHAILVVDRFHIAQLANAAVTEVRRRITMQQRGRRGRKGNREWELRNRLTRSAAKIHAEHLDPMVDDLAALPAKIGVPILAAWNAKEDLMDLIALMHTHPARTTIAHRLFRFYESCAASGYRNPANQRLRACCATTRRSRGHLTTRTSGKHGQPR